MRDNITRSGLLLPLKIALEGFALLSAISEPTLFCIETFDFNQISLLHFHTRISEVFNNIPSLSSTRPPPKIHAQYLLLLHALFATFAASLPVMSTDRPKQ